jgi:selenocysteine lyase/cysteine desulfurase
MATTYTVQELAQRYAESLVEYYEAVHSDVVDRERWVREASDAMHDAHAALNNAALRAAELNRV